MRYVAIHGTWARAEARTGTEWWQVGSAFELTLQALNASPVFPADPFRWSGDVNGVAGLLHRVFGKPPHDKNDWLAAADALRWYLARVPYEDRNLIVHSHGLQPVLLALADPVLPCGPIRTLTSIGSPVRADMREEAAIARPRIAFWQHLFDAKFDRMGSLGELGDGSWEWWWNPTSRRHPNADLNIAVEGMGHSKALFESFYLALWANEGWLANIERAAGPRAA